MIIFRAMFYNANMWPHQFVKEFTDPGVVVFDDKEAMWSTFMKRAIEYAKESESVLLSLECIAS